MSEYENEHLREADPVGRPFNSLAILALIDQGDAHLAELKGRYGVDLAGCPIDELMRFNQRQVRITAMLDANSGWNAAEIARLRGPAPPAEGDL